MPIQAPQWTDYLNCPVCCREFGPPPRSPVSLGCGHTLCRHCLNHLHKKQCPFDQTVIQFEPDDLVVNTALLQLAGYPPPAQPYHPPCIQALPERDRLAYDVIVRCMEHLAVYLKYNGNGGSNMLASRLSRPMQRKLVTLLQCAVTEEEGRGRMARAARSLGERTVTELILQHQNPQQISAYLWAAVRARGCQFLGPAMQEEVLKLVLLALEDGSALSRKVLVMFVVQRLKPHFPQASKTSIGHVVQLLYRASCFKVSKRESDSSLMQLKEEFRTYDLLRREHDAQIVQIATESGLRIAPDQWSALLYGDTAHKSHMQSIIDKLQTPQSFSQSVQELFIALHRTGDPAQLIVMSMHLERLASIDVSPDVKGPSWQVLAEVMTSLKEVVSSLSHQLQQHNRDPNHNQKHIVADRTDSSTSLPSPQSTHPQKFEATRPYRVNDEEVDRFQWPHIVPNQHVLNGNIYHNVQQPTLLAMPQALDTYNGNGGPTMPRPQGPQMQPQVALPHPEYYGYAMPIPVRYPGMPGAGAALPPNGDMPCPDMMHPQHFGPIPDHVGPRFHGISEEQAKLAYAQNARFQAPVLAHMPYQAQEASSPHAMPNMETAATRNSPYKGDNASAVLQQPSNGDMMQVGRYIHEHVLNNPRYHSDQPTYAQMAAMRRPDLPHNPFNPEPSLPHGMPMDSRKSNNSPFPADEGNPSAARHPGANGDMMQARYFIPIPNDVMNGVQRYQAGLPPKQEKVVYAQLPPYRQEVPNIPYHGQEAMPNPINPIVPNNSPYNYEENLLHEYRHIGPVYEPRQEAAWVQNNNVFAFNDMREMLPNMPSTSNGIYGAAVRRPISNAHQFHQADDDELEEELLALEQRICTEFKSTD